MKRLLFILLVLFLLAPLAFAQAGKNWTFTYVTPGLDVPFWRDVSIGIHRAGEAMGIKIVDADSRNSAATQFKNVQDQITAGVDAILISPTDSASCPAVLELAEKAKVPVVIVDIGTDSGNYLSFVKTDNVGGSGEAAKYLAAQLKKKGWSGSEIGMIDVSLARSNGRDRLKGFKDVMEAQGFKVIAPLEGQNYTRVESMKFAQDILTAHPGIRGFYGAYDEAILGTITAVETMNKMNDLLMVSFDGSLESVQALKDGKLGAIAAQQAVLMGRLGLNAAVDYLNGKQVKKRIDVPCFLVTRENVEQSMKKLSEDVFTSGK